MKKLLFILVVCCLCVACEKDYKNVWLGTYDIVIDVSCPSSCRQEYVLREKGLLFHDESMQENELGLKYGNELLLVKIADKKSGLFVETNQGETYEKGYLLSSWGFDNKKRWIFYYQKRERNLDGDIIQTTIEGEKR